jgi:hypothetical protein
LVRRSNRIHESKENRKLLCATEFNPEAFNGVRAAPRETPNSQATSAPLRRLDREEIAYLLRRGAELVAAGELGPVRLVLQRAAEAADPNARRVIGVAPDTAMARAWYEKAKEFGSTDASRRLELLARAVKVEWGCTSNNGHSRPATSAGVVKYVPLIQYSTTSNIPRASDFRALAEAMLQVPFRSPLWTL